LNTEYSSWYGKINIFLAVFWFLPEARVNDLRRAIAASIMAAQAVGDFEASRIPLHWVRKW
jgi:hypothetical protein